MQFKSLQQLRDESKSHTDRASQFFKEAFNLFRLMQNASSIEEYLEMRKEWQEKDGAAREEVKKSSDVFTKFVDEIERLKNHSLN